MIKNKLKDFLVIYIFSSIFVFLLGLVIIKTLSNQEIDFLIKEQRSSYILIGVYFIIISFVCMLLFYSILYIASRKKDKRIIKALKALNDGQYSATIFLKMFSDDTNVQITQAIDQEFLKLHKKIMVVSEEAVSATQQAAEFSKETKEEILEKERHRLARELHDSVSQQLFAAAMLLSAIEEEKDQYSEQMQKQLQLINKIIGEAQSEMRALLLHLRPVKLAGRTLKLGIEQLLKELESKVPIKITYDIEDVKLPQVVEDHLFRIVQELLSNVLRHSQAKELEVFLVERNSFYQLKVVDDGKGFEMNEKLNQGFGLSNIKERITSLGGNVRIISFPNQGTSIEVKIPLISRG